MSEYRIWLVDRINEIEARIKLITESEDLDYAFGLLQSFKQSLEQFDKTVEAQVGQLS